MTAGGLIAFVAYVAMAIEPGANLARMYGNARQAGGALARIEEVMNIPVAADPPGARELPAGPAEIVFDRVGLSYEPGAWALRGVSFRIRPGEHVALVGPSGAGKSSVLGLLLRFYDPSEGAITIGGVDATEIRADSLRRQVAYVPQETVLFAGTVRENIAYGRPDASAEDVRAAARAANADEFVATLPRGYETSLAESGLNLSGGQRQRIAIARALLLDPKIILLDEATSSLDTASETLVQEAVERLTQGRTAILIAHRLSTVRGADRILVMSGGGIVEEGNYEELLRRHGAFWRLAQGQLIPEADVNPAEARA
jgi:ABC-type multidrug transport system fused ATPase/permease subunit